MTKIAVFGTGYVGLIAGACFAKYNNHVICVDIDKEKVEKLNAGQIPIYEPGLKDILDEVIAKKNIEFTTDAEYAIKNSLVHYICVGTPTNPVDGSADLKYVFKVAEEIGNLITDYAIIVDKSTVPVGTGKKVKEIIKRQLDARGISVPYDVVSNPEFLREGSSVKDFLYPDRVVVGVEGSKAADVLKQLYEPFTRNGNPIIVMDSLESAEMTKYAANAFLAMKIAFNNQLARLSELVGADIRDVVKGYGSDSRIGKQFLYPGPGYGGSCFPKDTKALAVTGIEKGLLMTLTEETIRSNEAQKEWCAEKIAKHYQGNIVNRIFAIWGLAFKAKTDDMRDSSAITIIDYLLKNGADVQVHDPEALENARKIFGEGIKYCATKEEALEGSDSLIVLTEWDDYRFSDLGGILGVASSLNDKTIFDFRNLYPQYKNELKANGINWYGVGITQ